MPRKYIVRYKMLNKHAHTLSLSHMIWDQETPTPGNQISVKWIAKCALSERICWYLQGHL